MTSETCIGSRETGRTQGPPREECRTETAINRWRGGNLTKNGITMKLEMETPMERQEDLIEKREIDQQEDNDSGYDKEEFTIPDGGYGWFIVVAVVLLNANTWGANSGFAIYLLHYLNNGMFKGGDKYDYALIGGMTFGVGLFFAPIVNYISGKVGLRATIIIGNCLQFAALMMASFAVNLWQLYLTQGVMNAFGLAFIALPGMAILPQWFKRRRSIASAIAAGGSGIGGVVYNLGMQRVVEARSVFWALRAQSIMEFGMVWIAIILIRPRMSRSVQTSLYDVECLKSTGFWLLCGYVVCANLGYVIVMYDMANFTTSMGYSAYQGSIASAMVQVGSLFGRPLVGLVAHLIGPVTTTLLAYLLCAVFCFAMWIPARNLPTIYIFCIIIGGLMGTIYATIPPLLGKLVGLRKVGVALCLAWIFLGCAGIASPVIGIALTSRDPNANGGNPYLHCSIFAGCAFTAASLFLLTMRGYVYARECLAEGVDADLGHMHIRVPFMSPFKSMWVPKQV